MNDIAQAMSHLEVARIVLWEHYGDFFMAASYCERIAARAEQAGHEAIATVYAAASLDLRARCITDRPV
jgi:hypothetical protein